MAEILNLYGNKSAIKDSNGAVDYMDINTWAEKIKEFHNLLNELVMGRYEEIMKAVAEQRYDKAVDILTMEVRNVVENAIPNHKVALEWTLSTLALEKLSLLVTLAEKAQQEKE